MPSVDLVFGSSQIDITPMKPIPLYGFAYRENQPFTGIASPLSVKAFVFKTGYRTRCLLIADVLWWPPELIASIRQTVLSRWSIEPGDLLLSATHTHSAPATSGWFHPDIGPDDEIWTSSFIHRVYEAIDLATSSLQPATMRRYRGEFHISMNRRIDKGVDAPTAAWPKGEIDHELTTLLVEDVGGNPLAALVHFACHPTILRGAIVSAEFPGVMCDALTRQLGEACTVGFLQGCCGDVGPIVGQSHQHKNDTFEEVERVGETLAADVLRSLGGKGAFVTPVDTPGRLTSIDLPFARVPSREELAEQAERDDPTGRWANLLLNRGTPPASSTFEIQHLPLGTNLSLVALNGEVVSRYGLHVKSMSAGAALPCGYCNGMTGYIVTDEQLANGGYESDESTIYLGLPSRFADGNERLITDALTKILTATP